MNPYKLFASLPQITEEINNELDSLYDTYLSYSLIDINPIKVTATRLIFGDLEAFIENDPASDVYGEVWCSLAFKSVRYHRYVSCILRQINDREIEKEYKFQITREISESIKAETHVEIHPRATIGERLYIDHGTNTVIGERCVIGNNCTILNNVVLGSAFNPNTLPKDRHPKIGNKVEIYNDAKVLGNIRIGDNCVIGARCIVTKDMPPNSKVSIVNQLMIQRGESIPKVYVYGVIPIPPRTLKILGENFLAFNGIRINVVDINLTPISNVTINNCNVSDNSIFFDIEGVFDYKNCYICISSEFGDLVITECMAVSRLYSH